MTTSLPADATPGAPSGVPSGAAPGAPTARPARRAFRHPQDGYLGGVAAGLGRHLGVADGWVRAFFVVSAPVGFGVLLYLGLWITLPMAPTPVESPGLESAARLGRRPARTSRLRDAGPVVALGLVVLGVAGMLDIALGSPTLLWPAFFAVLGVAVLWRQADQAQRERWLDTTGRLDVRRLVVGSGDAAAWARLATGLALLVAALLMFAVRAGRLQVAQDIVVAAVLGVVGLGVTLGPWLVRLVGDLGEERAARVRTQERADVAAHLHDSVLQTLALIQKNAGDAGQVARLARSQERELREWMYGEPAPAGSSVAAALKAAAASVEDTHGIAVELVTVGDAALDTATRAVVDAAREAMVNAAKHAGVGAVDVYAEARAGTVEVFVRDRGRGFVLDEVAEDRQGVRGSILDRVHRHGGRAEVRSTPDRGTEVRLSAPASSPADVHPDAPAPHRGADR